MGTSSTSLTNLTGSLASSTSGTGLGTGINVQQFVQFALANQTAQITNLQNQQTALGSQEGEIATINSQLSSLSDAVAALRDPLGALTAETATSSQPTVLGATASGAATPGAHTIAIANLATTSSYYSDAAASSSTTLANGDSIAISVGGSQIVSVTTSSTTNTLDQVADAINSATSAVHLSVINDANGARLALVSATSGAPGEITVSGGLHVAGGPNTALSFHQASQGLNANLTVDGVPVTSTSNTVSSVINGVTLNLAAPTGNNPVSLTVAPDTTSATTAINNFVTAYNTVAKEISGQFAINSDGTGGGVLKDDNSLREVQSALLSAVAYAIPGNNGAVNLASIGVNLQGDGTLAVDSATLNTALSSNSAAVQNLFQNATSGFAQNLSNAITNITSPSSGILTLDNNSIQALASSLTSQINDLQAALQVQETNLTTIYSNVNTTLQELPLLQNQLSSQIASLSSSSSK